MQEEEQEAPTKRRRIETARYGGDSKRLILTSTQCLHQEPYMATRG